MLCRGCTGFVPKTKKGFQREFFPSVAEFIDSSSYNNSLIQKFLCLGLWDQFSVNVQRNVAPIYLGYQAFIGELDERLSITVYYEFVDRVRLYLYQDKDFAWKISVVWSSWSLNAGIIELLTTKRLSKQPLKLYQFYTTRIKKKYGGRIKDIVEPLLLLLKENWRGSCGRTLWMVELKEDFNLPLKRHWH